MVFRKSHSGVAGPFLPVLCLVLATLHSLAYETIAYFPPFKVQSHVRCPLLLLERKRIPKLFSSGRERYHHPRDKLLRISTSLLRAGGSTGNEHVTQGANDEELEINDERDGTSSKSLLGVIALISLLTVTASAKIGLLPGPPLEGGSFDAYTDAMIAQDITLAVITGALGYIFVKANTWLAENGYLDPRDSRKIIHTLSIPLFILFWPAFSPAVGARCFAAVVTLSNIVRLYLAGIGQDNSLAFAVSRSGDVKEALGGPFLYVLILFATILLFWRSSPVGVIACSTMAAGDGLADLIGRRYGKNNKWWFSPSKSMAGTFAFWLGGTICSLGLVSWLQLNACFVESTAIVDSMSIVELAVRISVVTAVSAALELVPGVDDNWSVPLSAAVSAWLLLE